MLSLTPHIQIPISNHRLPRFNSLLIPTLIPACKFRKPENNCQRYALFLGFEFTQVRRPLKLGPSLDYSWSLGCHNVEEYGDLEADIMDFMEKSEKPSMFPSMEELERAGRSDLVRAIKKKRGWFFLGWDVKNASDNVVEATDSVIADYRRRIESCEQNGSPSFPDPEPEGLVTSTSTNLDSPQLATSHTSDTSQQFAADEGSGIKGILSRLVNQRNNDHLAIKLVKNIYESQSKSEDDGDERHSDTSLSSGGTDLEETSRLMPYYNTKGTSDSSGGSIRQDTEPDTWRSWLNRGTILQLRDFEAGEISFEKNHVDANKESYHDGTTVTAKEYDEDLNKHKKINCSEIRARLDGLDSELTTALQSIRSNEEVNGSSSKMQSLSDALEFQENEVMRAKQRLRSLRAKLAIVEGKRTLARIGEPTKVNVKHKQTGDARNTLQLLRTTCIEWPNSASEVLLSGSFDGWTTQRRMHKSKSGVFSINLQLYPGRYEIKFIVDGIWRVDPLRPTVYNNGHENNLFTVS